MVEFNVGETVEVTDEAFKGSWYLAKVTGSFVKKGKKKILIEYEMLKADENGLKSFQDFVDVRLVRPHQQPQEKPIDVFQVNQVVDAFLGKGWWKGVVTKVLEDSRYVVEMESLVLEEKMEFGFDELRVHHDWINGQWITPQAQDRDTNFSQSDAKEADQAQPWQVGNTISINIGHGLSTVKWNIKDSTSQSGTKGAAAENALSRIPQPKLSTNGEKLPLQKDKCQNAETTPAEDGENDVVMLCHKCDELTSENGNLPCTKAIGDGEDNTVMQDHNYKEVTLESEELPSTMDIEDRENGVMQDHSCEDITLTDGKWKSPKSVEDGKKEVVMQNNSSNEDGEDKTVMLDHEDKEMTLESEGLPTTMDIEDGENVVVMPKNSCEDATLTDGKWKSSKAVEDGKKEAIVQDNNSNEDMDTNRQEVVQKTSRAQPSRVGKTFRINSGNQSNRRKMKMFRKITKKKIVKIFRKRKITNTIESEENEIVQQDHNNDAVILENRKLPSNLDIENGEIEPDMEDHNCDIVALGNGNLASTEAVENRDNETVMQDRNSDEVTLKHNNWPFTKSYSLWKDVESREVFQRIPQQPHFYPLQELNEFLREGQAFGLMLSFADMVDKLSKAQFDEPRSAFDSKLDTLIRFEALGFNVERVRARIKEFIRLKDDQVKLGGTLQQFEEKVSKEKHEEDSLQSKINELDEKLGKLNESFDQMNKKRLMVEMKRQSTASCIVALQREHREIEEKIEGAKGYFTHVATEPWSIE
ncbi:hypothetical protein FRX31_028269 [Thalictrum thalictroides]|uniref:Agenet domain-containing protein n=1 Tax=Thalictrum thalictroides TaxID=46969 RepID=A0A7J6VD36_THATH|nr:hypothetical protein FRX31_028269 [Thalictrum thalictroides]